MLCFDSALVIHGPPSVPLSHYTSSIWVFFSLCSSVFFIKRQTALLTVSTRLMNVWLRCCMCLLITQPQCLCSYKSPQPVDVFWKQSGVICSSCLGSRTDQQFTQSYWLLSRETLVWHFRHPRCEGHSLCNLFARAQPGVVLVFETNKRSEDVLFWGELKQTALVTSSPAGSWLQQLYVKFCVCVFLRGFLHSIPVFRGEELGDGLICSQSGKSISYLPNLQQLCLVSLSFMDLTPSVKYGSLKLTLRLYLRY